MPLKVDVLTPGDYHLYLYQADEAEWYAVVEADHLFMADIVMDVESSFRVKVEGWCRLKECQKESGSNLLPPNSFGTSNANEWSDSEWDNYRGIVHEEYGMKYVLLRVTPSQV